MVRDPGYRGRRFGFRRPPPGMVAPYRVLMGWRWIVSGGGIALAATFAARTLPRRYLLRWLPTVVALAGGSSLLMLLEGLRGVMFPELKHVDLPIEDLPASFDGFKVGQLTDLHLGMPFTRRTVPKAASALMAESPDALVLTGDYISFYRHLRLLPPVLGSLQAPHGVFAIFGNHDHWVDLRAVERVLREAGITVLKNEHRVITTGDEQLVIAGVDDLWGGAPDLQAALAGVPTGAPIILLAHSPDFADEACQTGVAVQLSGHTHAGHIRLPVLGPLFLPRYGLYYDRAMYRVGRMLLYVSHGLGGLPIRLGSRAEVTVFTLRRTEGVGTREQVTEV